MTRHPRTATPGILAGAVVCALVIGSAVTAVVTYQAPKSNVVRYPYESVWPPKYDPQMFRFDPKPDITAYELAMSMIPIIGSNEFRQVITPFYDAMPQNVKRHWKPPTEKIAPGTPPAPQGAPPPAPR